jgi:UDP-glucose:glycoprotein glucosyltransferase
LLQDAYTALSFITDLYNSKDDETEAIGLQEVRDAFSSSYGGEANLVDVFGEDSDYDVGRSLAAEFIQRTGLQTFPQVTGFCNVGLCTSVAQPDRYHIFSSRHPQNIF